MTPAVNDLFRALAYRLTSAQTLDDVVGDDDDAIRLFVDVAHGGCCPGCGGRRWRPLETREIWCRSCGPVAAVFGSPFARRRVSIKHILAAVFAIFVDTSTTSARGFSRRTRLRLGTAWQLLHDVRAALPRATAQYAALVAPVLGKCAKANAAAALLSSDERRLVVVDALEGGPPGTPRRDLSLWLGRLRAWLTEVFRGVSAKHLWRYLSEFAARHGRVARRGLSHI